mgnify:CR=1 FL=1
MLPDWVTKPTPRSQRSRPCWSGQSTAPVVIEIVDGAEQIEEFLPSLDEMVSEGLVTLERVRIVSYRAAGDD